jgi:hypothetical protein
VLPVQAAKGAEVLDFGALLATKGEDLAPPGLALKPLEAAPPALPAPLPETAFLPESGNTLPATLPVATSGETAAAEPQRLPAPTSTAPARSHPGGGEPGTPAETLPRIVASQPQATTPIRTARTMPVAGPAAKPHSGEGEEPIHAEPPVAALLAQTLDTAFPPVASPPAERAPEPQTQPPGLPLMAPALPAAPLAAPSAPSPDLPHPVLVAQNPVQHPPASTLAQAKPNELSQPTKATAQPTPAPATLSVITVPTMPALRSDEPQVHLNLVADDPAQAREGAKPSVVIPRFEPPAAIAAERPWTPAKALPAFSADLTLPVAEPVAPAAALAAAAAPALSGASAFIPADPALRPHDFTQLVDRLIAARELAAPQGFQLAVQHGEFGAIRLSFRQEGDGLNVTMASTDPDFARVVSAAPAPVLPAATVSDPAAGQGGPRSDAQSHTATGNGQSTHSRGSSPERREDRHDPADNPAPRRHGEGRGSRRGGIFA